MFRKIFKYLFISLIPFGLYLFIVFIYTFSNNDHYPNLKNRLKWSIKDTLTANKQLEFWKKEYEFNVNTIENLNEKLLEKDYLLAEIPNLIKKIPIKESISQEFNLNDSKLLLKKFKTSYLTTSKHPGALGTSYIEYYDNKIFLVSANGLVSFTNVENFNSNKAFDFQIINTNIKDFVKNKLFYTNSEIGIKDVLIKDKKIYLSFTNLQVVSEDCYNTVIMVSEINTTNLEFKELFNPMECVKRVNAYGDFSAIQSGGRMFSLDKDNILFTVGDYRYRDHAQNPKNIFGTLQKINLRTKKSELLAYGLRNSQGLNFDEITKRVILTDHGPMGGDEINILNLEKKIIYNYGWPISSYGEHYGLKKRDESHPLYKKAPLHKSHKKYGFEEPIKYFVPSIGISEIILLPNKFLNKDEGNSDINLLYGALGNKPEEGDMSIHITTLNNKYKEIDSNILNIKERVRDIIYIKNLNSVFLMLETSASIGVLKLN